MVTKANAIKLASDFVTEIRETGLNIKKVILFGSFARNEQNEWSDIDVAIVADEFIGFSFEDRKYTAKTNIKLKYNLIETRTIPTSHFEQGDPFIEEIIKTGIEIKI